ncbi:MAG: hypothetical protein ACOYT4_03860 [Nanoarchaeota archaeon]
MIEFCPDCDSILIMGDNKKSLICKNCGFSKMPEKSLKLCERINKKEIGSSTAEEGNIFATYEFKCENCGHDKCEVIIINPSYSDEDTIIRYKCGKCGHAKSAGHRFK